MPSALTPGAASERGIVVRNVRRVYRHRGVETVAVEDVSFEVMPGKTLAVIGESGAGKSTLTRIVAGLEAPTSGEVLIDGARLTLRAGAPSPVQVVFQDPLDALSPYRSIGKSIGEGLRLSRTDRAARVGELLAAVGLPPNRAGDRPARFSGGQLQRIVLARALATDPSVLLCDEPTSALDVSVQAQIVNLLLAAQHERRFACVLVTHDLAVARVLADDVLVLKRGRAVEHAPAERFFAAPQADYSRTLLDSAGAAPARERLGATGC